MTGDGQLTRQNIFSRGDATSRDCSSFCCFLLQYRVKGGRPTQHSVAELVRVRTSMWTFLDQSIPAPLHHHHHHLYFAMIFAVMAS